MDYKKAGVDIEAGYKSVELMKKHVQETMRSEVLSGLGGFSGAFSMERYCLRGRGTIIFPGLYCLRQELSGENR